MFAWGWYGARPYNAAIGGRLAVTYYAKPHLSLTTDISVQSVDYSQAPHMNGTLASLGETMVYSLTPFSGATAKAGVSRQNARNAGFAYWSGYLAAGYFRDLPAGFSAYAEASLSFASYDEPLPSFGKRRVELAPGVTVNLLNRHIVLSRFTPRLTYTFTRQRSTIPLYSYGRNRVELGLTTTF